MITTFGFMLEERTPVLYKLISTRAGFKLFRFLAKLLFQFGVLSLKFFYLLLDNLELLSEQGNMISSDGGAPVLNDEFVKQVKKDSHG